MSSNAAVTVGLEWARIDEAVVSVLDELLDWSAGRPAWQRDALRRLVLKGELSDEDVGELAEICKAAHGLAGCLRCLLLVICTHPVAKEALTLHLAWSEGRKRYFGCNLMHRKVLASSHQHLMAEAPIEVFLLTGRRNLVSSAPVPLPAAA